MIVKGLNGREYKINLSKYINKERKRVSGPHSRAVELIKEIWPMSLIAEEIFLPGCKKRLYLDIFLPYQDIAVEVHGIQHTKFVAAFHKDKLDFIQSQLRDQMKREWCELNEIELVTLYDTEEDTWKQKLTQ